MDCEHYFVDDAGMQPASSKYERECFRLGVCINPDCMTSFCVDNYVDSGEKFEGRRLLFGPGLQNLIDEAFVSN